MDLVGVHHICECSLLLRNAIEQHVSGLDPTGDLCLENACAQSKYVGRFRTTVLALLNVADFIHVIVSILSVRCMFSHLLRYGTVSPLALNDVKDCVNFPGVRIAHWIIYLRVPMASFTSVLPAIPVVPRNEVAEHKPTHIRKEKQYVRGYQHSSL